MLAVAAAVDAAVALVAAAEVAAVAVAAGFAIAVVVAVAQVAAGFVVAVVVAVAAQVASAASTLLPRLPVTLAVSVCHAGAKLALPSICQQSQQVTPPV